MREKRFTNRGDAILAALGEVGPDGQCYVHEADCEVEWDDDGEWVITPCSCSPQIIMAGEG